MNKIAIFRALYLGDFLCSVPALRSIRKSYPNSEITLIGLSEMSHLAKRYSQYLDHFIPFPGFPLLSDTPFDPDKFGNFLENVRDQKFDIILQMQGNGSIINNLLKSFNAGTVVGFCQDKAHENENFLKYPENLHEIKRHLALLKHIGTSSTGFKIDFPIEDADRENLHRSGINLKGDYICIHPGSKASWRQWPLEHFAKIANYLSTKGYQIVITGTKPELDLARELSRIMMSEPVIAAGKLNLGGTAVLLSNAKFLVTNCTGISHLSAALEVPSLVISMDGEPHRWGPLNKKLHRTFDWTKNPDYQAVFKELRSIPFIVSHTSSGEG